MRYSRLGQKKRETVSQPNARMPAQLLSGARTVSNDRRGLPAAGRDDFAAAFACNVERETRCFTNRCADSSPQVEDALRRLSGCQRSESFGRIVDPEKIADRSRVHDDERSRPGNLSENRSN